MNTYNQLKRIKKTAIVELTTNGATLAVCPDMGGRIFGELAGISLHRIDLDCTAIPAGRSITSAAQISGPRRRVDCSGSITRVTSGLFNPRSITNRLRFFRAARIESSSKSTRNWLIATKPPSRS